ncbi:DUF3667 domain-containing protein [Flavobacterium sp.]|uniref:DUF3667 domain-containing protein n=1 Tax=Flavobacterium sp. TaxID=239 RepID=UPI003D6B961A
MSEKICSYCGKSEKPKRINSSYIVQEIEHVLHFERGILYTIRELLTRPGQNIRDFISENRSRLVKPILFIIVTSLIYTLINHFFHIEGGYVKIEDTKESTGMVINNWIQHHYGYANIIMGVFIAFWLKLFFRKYDYNFFEILIVLCFVMGMEMLLFSVFALIEGLTHLQLMPIAAVTVFIYFSWAIGQFFDKTKPVNYVKALVSYVLGMLTFSLSTVVLIVLIDFVVKR